MNQKIPEHIAIIMDGNGRWAENRNLARAEGHKAGIESVKTIIQSCLEKKISCLSLFAFSSENWLRPAEEVNFLMELFITALGQELQSLHEHGIKLRFTGNRDSLSSKLLVQMLEAETLTQKNTVLVLNIVINYGGKWDIVQAAKKMFKAVELGELDINNLDESSFTQYLDTAGLPEVDLFIRTSGELRISNFFLWQLAYTELYFTEECWPDFKQHSFEKALLAFNQRNRRFGCVSAGV